MVIDTLSPQAQQWLQQEAQRAQVGVETYVARLIEGAAGLETDLAPGSREWERELRGGTVSVPPVSLAQRLALLNETPPVPAGRIPLSDEALRRETMYAEDGC